jgi:GDPmannose 4,6-dehydratase
MKRALITGITGQDGSYLAELLLSKQYEVHGLIRRASSFNTSRIEHIYHDPHIGNGDRLFLHYGDATDAGSLIDLIYSLRPDEIYHLAAQSHVRVSFDLPEHTGEVTALGTMRILEAIHKSGVHTRFYQASSSEMFGCARPPQNEDTAFEPQSPYAVALAAIVAGKQRELYLGNLDARRDWGYAPDYVAAMWRMLQCDQPGDFVIGSGESHSVRELLDEVFGYVNLDWRQYVRIDARYFRPSEVDFLQADPAKARRVLGWEPRVFFKDLVRIMVDADLELVGEPCPGEGRKILDEKFDGWHRWEHQVVSMER